MKHGEYKTPGGKLVVADFAVCDGVVRDVVVSGDFFLYPEEALTVITGAVEGAPAESTADEIAGRVRAALGPEVTLLGFTPEAVGRAVRRGFGDA
ncbi:MAG: biotin--protein ligase [Thermomicrobiales bacterium]|nr:biotin--protein ligase [Thermomicrobiales bacterium]